MQHPIALNIIHAIKDGDEIVFRELFNEYHEKLYYFIFGKTKSEYLAEETVQLTFIKLWQYRATLSEDYKISTQIFRIATTTLIDLLRKENREKNRFTNEEFELPAQPSSITNTLETKELYEKVKEASGILPPARRQVFELSRFEGMSYKEIAAHLSISEKTVENHISMSLKQIKAYLSTIISVTLMIISLFLR